MEKFIGNFIRVVALIMLVVGLVMAVVSHGKMESAEIHSLFNGDPMDVLFWKSMIYVSLASAFNSIFVFAFSFIVEASVIYINEKRESREDKKDSSESKFVVASPITG